MAARAAEKDTSIDADKLIEDLSAVRNHCAQGE